MGRKSGAYSATAAKRRNAPLRLSLEQLFHPTLQYAIGSNATPRSFRGLQRLPQRLLHLGRLGRERLAQPAHLPAQGIDLIEQAEDKR